MKGEPREKPDFLLVGLLICGSCGKSCLVQGAKGNRYHYYVCRTLVHRGAGTCQSKYLNAEATDGEFIEQLTERLSSPLALSWMAESATAEVASTGDDFTGILAQVTTALDGIEERLAASGELVSSESIPLQTTLPSLAFLRSQKEQLPVLRDEVSRSKPRYKGGGLTASRRRVWPPL